MFRLAILLFNGLKLRLRFGFIYLFFSYFMKGFVSFFVLVMIRKFFTLYECIERILNVMGLTF